MLLASLAVGIRNYLETQYSTLDSAFNSAEHLRDCLDGFDNVHINSVCAGAIEDTVAKQKIQDVAQATTFDDTLMIVFSGHGQQPTGHVVCTNVGGRISPTDIATAVTRCNYANIVVVIDACYSGDFAFSAGPLLGSICANVVIMASSSPGQVALATPGSKGTTLFIQALIDVLEDGIPGIGPMLDAFSVAAGMNARLRNGLQRPHLFSQSSLDVHLVPNRAHTGSAGTDSEPLGLLMVFDPELAEEAEQLANDLASVGGPEVTLLTTIDTGTSEQLARLVDASQFTLIVLPDRYTASTGWARFAAALAITSHVESGRPGPVPILLGEPTSPASFVYEPIPKTSREMPPIHKMLAPYYEFNLQGHLYYSGVEDLAQELTAAMQATASTDDPEMPY